jgi:VanZ family protein
MSRKPLLPGLIWTLIIVLLTLTPGNYIPKITNFFDWISYDKLVHLFLFGIYAILLFYGLHHQKWNTKIRQNAVFTGFLIGMVFALLTEVMQKFVIPGRYGNLYDFLADVLGLVLGYLFWHIIRRNDKKKLSTSKKYI